MIGARSGMRGRGRVIAFALLGVALFMRLTAGTLTMPAPDPAAEIARIGLLCDSVAVAAGLPQHRDDHPPAGATQDETWLLAEAADAPALVAAVLLFTAIAVCVTRRAIWRDTPARAPPRQRWTSLCPQGPPLSI